MHVDLVLPTHNRWASLRKTIESLEQGTYTDFTIHLLLVTTHKKMPNWFNRKSVKVTVFDDNTTQIKRVNSCVGGLDGDIVAWITDTSIFHPSALEITVKAMQQHFPDLMGIVGVDLQLIPIGFYLFVGRRYIDHFPEKHICCPDYMHYGADKELWLGANALGCFYLCLDKIVKCTRINDKTAELSKSYLYMDHPMRRERRVRGYLWGRDFNLIKGADNGC